MQLPSRLHTTAMFIVATALNGCSLAYNGALVSPPTEVAQNYDSPGTAKQPATGPVRGTMTYVPGLGMGDSAPVVLAGGPGNPSQARATTRRELGAVGLWGSIPRQGAPRSSPMDSPDNLRRVSFATEGADFDPRIDPTGTYMVYASTQHRVSSDLYVKRVDGSAVTQLTNDPGNDVMPAFSPDGRQVVFASDRSGNWDIYIMETQGGQPVQLTQDASHEVHPSFSPDGRQVVFCSLGAQSGQWELVVMDVANPAVKRFIGYGLFPEWSPTTNKIVFQRARERGTKWFSIWTIDLVNGEGILPTEIAASSNAAAITPSWSPDGKFIAFCTVINPESEQASAPQQADVWVVSADGSGRANLTHSQFTNVQPAWSPDGSIYFVSNRAQNARESIWSIRPDRALKVVDASGMLDEQRSAMGESESP